MDLVCNRKFHSMNFSMSFFPVFSLLPDMDESDTFNVGVPMRKKYITILQV